VLAARLDDGAGREAGSQFFHSCHAAGRAGTAMIAAIGAQVGWSGQGRCPKKKPLQRDG
jgi:hypothetical protein